MAANEYSQFRDSVLSVDLVGLLDEVARLDDKHGRFESKEHVAFHVGRAYRTFERCCDDKSVAAPELANLLRHLAAVALRGSRDMERGNSFATQVENPSGS